MLPAGFAERMQKLLKDEYPAFLDALAQPRSLGLRLNPLKTDAPPELPFSLKQIPWEPLGYYYSASDRPGLHPWHDAGLYYLQEPSAMAPAALLDPQPGERILDLCAAPGGKTTQIAGRMQGKGLLVSNEIHPNRAKILSSNVERLGIANALVLNEHPARLAERFIGWFDRVLVDAPCSGEGMFRRSDAACADWSEQLVEACAKRQSEILESAVTMLRPGGRLVYSTCTFSPEEDEGVVQSLLERHPELSLEETDCPFFSEGRPDWIADGRPELRRACRLFPHKLSGDGHFAAVLRKNDGEPPAPDFQPEERLSAETLRFAMELGVSLPEGICVRFGQTEFLAPKELPELRGLRALRPGLELGSVQKGRFEPAHALALWLKDAANKRELTEQEAADYLSGLTVSGTASGWTLLTFGGLSIGWGKGSNGVIKNRYPKGLRRNMANLSRKFT